MTDSLASTEAMRSAFRVAPEVAKQSLPGGPAICAWSTPPMDGFELPCSDDLVVALHLGGSQRVREMTDRGLSRYCSAPGHATLLPPNRAAAFHTGGSISLVTLHFSGDLLDHVDNQLAIRLSRPDAARFAFSDPFIRAGMEAMLQAARSGLASPNYFSRLAEAVLCHIAQRCMLPLDEADHPEVPDIQLGRITLCELVALIDRRLDEKLSIDELARLAGRSRSAFTREFRRATGASAHQFLNVRRVEAAKKLLRGTELDLAHIAQETGFSSQSHFTDVFRELAGCTPSQFRLAGP